MPLKLLRRWESKFNIRHCFTRLWTLLILSMSFFFSQVVDMRWGVRDEATDDHMTTQLCMQEIDNCQRLSMGPNFVVISLILLIFYALSVACVYKWCYSVKEKNYSNAVPAFLRVLPCSSYVDWLLLLFSFYQRNNILIHLSEFRCITMGPNTISLGNPQSQVGSKWSDPILKFLWLRKQ